MNEVTVSGNASITGDTAGLFANSKVTLDGVVTVEGDVRSGGSISMSGNPEIQGQVVENSGSVAYPPPFARADAAKADNDNDALAPGAIEGGELKLSGQTVLDMPAGVYYFANGISISGQAQINVLGDVEIYVDGPVSISGISNTNPGQGRLELFSVSEDDVRISGTSSSTLHVVAPLADVNISGTADFVGTVLGYNVKLSGTPNIGSAGDASAYDSSCADTGPGSGPDLPQPPH